MLETNDMNCSSDFVNLGWTELAEEGANPPEGDLAVPLLMYLRIPSEKLFNSAPSSLFNNC